MMEHNQRRRLWMLGPMVVVALEKDDRPPAPAAELPVDLPDELVELFLERPVACDAAPARGRELDEGEPPAVVRSLGEEASDRGEPLR